LIKCDQPFFLERSCRGIGLKRAGVLQSVVATPREIGQVCPCIEDPVGSPIVEILHRVEGGDVERGSNLGKILAFAIVHIFSKLYLSLTCSTKLLIYLQVI